MNFGTNGKRVCNFQLVVNYCNLGPIFPRFRDITDFLLRTATPPIFHPNLHTVHRAVKLQKKLNSISTNIRH